MFAEVFVIDMYKYIPKRVEICILKSAMQTVLCYIFLGINYNANI